MSVAFHRFFVKFRDIVVPSEPVELVVDETAVKGAT